MLTSNLDSIRVSDLYSEHGFVFRENVGSGPGSTKNFSTQDTGTVMDTLLVRQDTQSKVVPG